MTIFVTDDHGRDRSPNAKFESDVKGRWRNTHELIKQSRCTHLGYVFIVKDDANVHGHRENDEGGVVQDGDIALAMRNGCLIDMR